MIKCWNFLITTFVNLVWWDHCIYVQMYVGTKRDKNTDRKRQRQTKRERKIDRDKERETERARGIIKM